MDKNVEHEVKYELDPVALLPDLSGVAEGVTAVERPAIHLLAEYFDTPDLRLLDRGITLRRRKDLSGKGEEGWTLKLPGGARSVGLQRSELSWPGGSQLIPPEATDIVTGVTRGASLVSVAEVDTHRRRVELRDPLGTPLAEIDDDRVTVTTTTVTSFREVEVELAAGGEELLRSVGARLCAQGATKGDDVPKVRRALMPGPSTPAPAALDRTSAPLATVVSGTITDSLERLTTHDMGIRVEADVESIHQARVATRRLRSDLTTFADVLDAGWVTRIRADLRWLGSALGEVRDADVLAERLDSHASGAADTDADAFRGLVAHLAEEREVALRRLISVMTSPRYLSLLDDLHQAVRRLPVAAPSPTLSAREGLKAQKAVGAQKGVGATAPATDALGRRVGVAWRSLRRGVDRLDKHPDLTALHRIRIKTKRVRYASEVAAPVVGRHAKTFARSAAALQGKLGDLNDAFNAEGWFRRTAVTSSPTVAFAAGQCAGAERRAQQAAMSGWRQEWKQLERASRRSWVH